MKQDKSIPDFTQIDHSINTTAYTTESIVADSHLDLNIYTDEQNTVEVLNSKNEINE